MNNNRELFKKAHALTAKVIRRDLGDSYAATFAACLRYVRNNWSQIMNKLESTGYTATIGEHIGQARALLSKNGKTMSVWASTAAETLPEPLKAAVRAAGGNPETRVMVRERALGLNMAIEKDFYEQIQVAIAVKQAEIDAQPERIMAKLIAQRTSLAEKAGYIAEAAHEDHVSRVEAMSANGFAQASTRDFDAEENAARAELAKFDTEYPEVVAKIKADKQVSLERHLWD